MPTRIRDADGVVRTKADLGDNLQHGAAGVLASRDVEYVNRYAPVRNVARFTEAVGSWAFHMGNSGAGATKTGNSKKALIDGLLVNLDEVNVNASVWFQTRYAGAGFAPFVAGQRYMISFYAWAATDQQLHMGSIARSRYIPANQLTRIWGIGHATSTTFVDMGSGAGTVPLGGGPGDNPPLGYTLANIPLSYYIGGIQISGVPANYKDGIAMIGDSTMAGGSGKTDIARDFRIMNNREVSTVLAQTLQCGVFNRAVGGERTDAMDARWAADITPLAATCREVHIQGGINDINQGRSLADIQTSITSMVAKAIADGMDYKLYTCTPTNAIGADTVKETKRLALNAWLKQTYGERVFDISSVVEDPENPGYLLPEYWGDGVHYPGNAKTSIARYIASHESRFSWLRQPPLYQPVYV